MKKLHAFLVPLHSEGIVIQNTLQSFKKAGVDLRDVYLVDDCSQDDTLFRVFETGFPVSNILPIEKNVGKTMALIKAFEYFKIVENYEFVNTGDGDTLLAEDYLKKLIPILNDLPKSTAAVASRVCSVRDSWNAHTSYRCWEYWLMQVTYKRAQGYINCVTVLPGCGTTFRTEVFEKLSKEIRTDILTEDMLWTARTHLEGHGRILYAHSLRVFTQDPATFKDYKKQNTRWFQGGWQVYREQKMWKVFDNKINAETSFLFWEGLFFSVIFLFAFIAAAFNIFPNFVYWFFHFDFYVFIGMTLLGAIWERDLRIAVWMPFFYILRILKCLIFLHSFVKIMIFRSDKRKQLLWNKVERY